jgi:hypothetical protein
MRALATLLALAACQDAKELGGGAGLDLPWFDVVYQCDAPKHGDGTYEFCFDDSAAELEQQLAAQGIEATCYPTPRHLGPCVYGCEPGHSGNNAYNGSFCP